MAKQLQQSKKKSNTLYIVLAVLVVFAIFILTRPDGDEGSSSVNISDAVKARIQKINSEVAVPKNLFEQRMLEQFDPYDPAQAPQEHGRDNPFVPAPQPEEVI